MGWMLHTGGALAAWAQAGDVPKLLCARDAWQNGWSCGGYTLGVSYCMLCRSILGGTAVSAVALVGRLCWENYIMGTARAGVS